MSHHHGQQLSPASSTHAFLACSAFEFGGDCAHREPESIGGGITALQYPMKGLRGHCAKPFERAVVRLTRESLSVYRPTDPGLHAELCWRSVRERRRHMSRKGGRVLYEFAFFTHSSILVLEVADAGIAGGIVAALQLLNGWDVSFALQAHAAETVAATTADTARARTIQRGDQGGEALRRIRVREEEMREAIFYLPSRRSPAASLRTEQWQPTRSPPFGSSSPAPRPKSQPLPRHPTAAALAEASAPSLPRSVSGPLSGASTCWSGAETVAEVRALLHLLEQEEKKSSLSLKSQGERIRALHLIEETHLPQPSHQQVATTRGAPSSLDGQQQAHTEFHEEDGTEAIQTVSQGGHALTGRPPRALQETQPPSQPDRRQKLSPPPPPQQQQQRPFTGSVGSTELNMKCEGRRDSEAATSALASPDQQVGKNEAVNEASRIELQREAEQHKTQLSSGKPLLLQSQALAQEQRDLALLQEGEAAASPESQPLVKTPTSCAKAAATTVAEAPPATKAGGGVVYGSWKELRHKPTGRTYYRHIVTKEAQWEAPSEVLEMKKAAAATQQEVQEEPTSVKKGALRVCGVWKEFRDPKRGRLYYVNTETKQRTWKMKDTSFANE
ncbi:hypothetical protein TraAM80_08393 [Trypanosoma rangeli]|uniref:WW domain-containing protein n=1 Tax=Trypanosoma rangeli TaxID=5698 RepID=A0A3R7M477_TRYRA|nr:uncharacterized protein TraAM80_08393 [Trypanosoma rangeli]RNE99105.1 hypothetical protein TraAM80_08393 [Trypanosoma rangeli]|eukprot:RNE99105.1 hypothetical protein TraAM80_08393 [Trypanosoma rangeli]